MKQTTDLLQYIDTKRKEHAKQEAHDLTRFRQQHQQAPARREWDLNDPQRLLKDLPARVSDTDARCGVSSLQKFDGEDLKGAERERLQKLQVRAWAYEGRLAKERARREEEALKWYCWCAVRARLQPRFLMMWDFLQRGARLFGNDGDAPPRASCS